MSLDLDPNKSLASQIGNSGKDEISTIDSTYVSMDVSVKSVVSSDGTSESAPTSFVGKIEQSPHADDGKTVDDKCDDDKSDASSLTFRTTPEEKSVDLTTISSFLDRMETLLTGQTFDTTDDVGTLDKGSSPRFTTAEEVERKLNELIETFDVKRANESRDKKSKEHYELLEKSRADISKLSALLSKEIADAADSKLPTQQMTDIEANIESLPSLLSQVLQRLEKPIMEESDEDENDSNEQSPNKALESLFAKRVAIIEEVDAQPRPLNSDPEYAKYFKMLKLGLPRESVIKAIERDGKDAKVLDLDPNRPLAAQTKVADEHDVPDKNSALKALFSKRAASMKQKEEGAASAALEALFVKHPAHTQQEGSAPALRVDNEFQKYMKMLKIGMPRETVIKALERDGKDITVVDMDPEKSYASQVKKIKSEESDPPLKEEYAKFFKVGYDHFIVYIIYFAIILMSSCSSCCSIFFLQMLKVSLSHLRHWHYWHVHYYSLFIFLLYMIILQMGLPIGAVRQALQREGKDPNIVDMDPEKSYASQNKSTVEKNDGPLLKDDPEFIKYFKVSVILCR